MFILNSNDGTTKKPFGFLWYEFIQMKNVIFQLKFEILEQNFRLSTPLDIKLARF